jgi:hypothetical protein
MDRSATSTSRKKKRKEKSMIHMETTTKEHKCVKR